MVKDFRESSEDQCHGAGDRRHHRRGRRKGGVVHRLRPSHAGHRRPAIPGGAWREIKTGADRTPTAPRRTPFMLGSFHRHGGRLRIIALASSLDHRMLLKRPRPRPRRRRRPAESAWRRSPSTREVPVLHEPGQGVRRRPLPARALVAAALSCRTSSCRAARRPTSRGRHDRLPPAGRHGRGSEGWRDLPIGEVVGRVGLRRRKPLPGGHLDITPDRRSARPSRGLGLHDLLESALASPACGSRGEPPRPSWRARWSSFAIGAARERTTPRAFTYTSDWLHDNDVKGALRVTTSGPAGARRLAHGINYMSTHPGPYRRFAPIRSHSGDGEDEALGKRAESWYVSRARRRPGRRDLPRVTWWPFTTTIGGLDCGAHRARLP